MKSKILMQAIGVSFLCLSALPSVAQKGGGASGGASAGVSVTPTAPAGASGKTSAQAGAQQQLQTGQLIGNGAGADANASGTATTSDDKQQQPNNPQIAATNAAAAAPASPSTNAQGLPPGGPLSPTSRSGATNALYPTNSMSTNNTPDWLQRDQAITEQDRAMLAQMRQAVFQGQPISGWMHSIHFILKDGAVRIVGTVPSVAERQRIEAVVTQIPGVVKVYDALAVNASAGANAGPANASVNGNAAAGAATPPAPTSFAPTNIGGRVPPDSKFTNIIYETAPQPK
jgi:BON domain